MIKQVILITGCSSGIGLDAALTLQRRGHQVIASCRKEDDLRKLSEQGLDAVLLDVNDSSSIKSGFNEALSKTQGRLDVLINNAGYGQAGALEDISRDLLRAQFETNVFGLLELSNFAIPIMRQQGRGRIINLSSILGIISLPFRGAYNASKYAVEGLSDTLRLELSSSGIKVITIEPGPIESHFRDTCLERVVNNIDMQHSHFYKQYTSMLATYKEDTESSFFMKKTDAVIKKLIHAIEAKHPKTKYPVTIPTHMAIFFKRVLSNTLLDKLLLLASKKELSS